MNEISQSDFVFTEDFAECCREEYSNYCLHILCLSGAARFAVGDTLFNVIGGDAIIKSSGKPITIIHCSKDFSIKALLISWTFLYANTPQSSYNTIGNIATTQNPVMPMQQADLDRCLLNFEEIRRRLDHPYHNFYADVLRRAVETMIFDFYDIHARMTHQNIEGVSQASRILQRFVTLLQEGLYKKERRVEYYASRLFITPKYLSEACVDVSGYNASSWIEYFTTQEIAHLLSDRSKSLIDIAYELNFSSPSYLSRYVKRVFGCSPSDYRKRLK
ncbi:MAG: AraC family transcriptional regulator [Muribaculaceae bacterium]|nr:AraC family transcriptional regulator [Muribaculaceae bacterium]MBR5436190.1 AraC family transcriptional regulator [Muribaculaceae bacterium]